jgi:DNA (cytosine-5)-methyltransferase 1
MLDKSTRRITKEYLGNIIILEAENVGFCIDCLWKSRQRAYYTLAKKTERCHPLEERPLTIREYARIQTFDDTYEFVGGMSSQYKQIGNAVPVKLAKCMGESLLNVLRS